MFWWESKKRRNEGGEKVWSVVLNGCGGEGSTISGLVAYHVEHAQERDNKATSM